MILPRQKIYKFDFILLIKSLLNLNFFKNTNLLQNKLENKISKFIKIRFCTIVPRGRVGLKIILNLIKKKNFNKNYILMSPFTIFDVVNMVISENLKPKFLDINKSDYSLNLNDLKKKINKKTLAVILTHYHIEPIEYKKIVNYCSKKNIFLIEDRAIAFRKSKKKEKLNQKHFIFFSFSPFKFISTINLGVVATNNKILHSQIIKYKKKFCNNNIFYIVKRIFFTLKYYFASRNLIFFILFHFIKLSEIFNISNFKNLLKNDPNPEKYLNKYEDDYFVKISSYQLKSASDQIDFKTNKNHLERQKKAKIYSHNLSNVKNVFFKEYSSHFEDCYLSFPILCKNRDKLYKYLLNNNLDTSKYFYRDCNRLKIFKKFKSKCPNVKYVSDHILLLPLYPNYPEHNIRLICKKITEFYNHN
jgi:dTDP-4-amino-4,6-dideoxygalactose transaminase